MAQFYFFDKLQWSKLLTGGFKHASPAWAAVMCQTLNWAIHITEGEESPDCASPTITLNRQPASSETSRTKGRNKNCHFKSKAAGPAQSLRWPGRIYWNGSVQQQQSKASVIPHLPTCPLYHLLYCSSLFTQETPVECFMLLSDIYWLSWIFQHTCICWEWK